MAKVMAHVLKSERSRYPDKEEVDAQYQVGEKLYMEYTYKQSSFRYEKGVAEFEVQGIVLNTMSTPHETMLDIRTDDAEYIKRVHGNSEFLIFESDIQKYLAKNTELLHEMRGQLASSLYTNGEQYANVELDNGRHIAINEIKDKNGALSDRLRVTLYANSDEIQQNIFKNTHYVIRKYEGSGSVDFLYQSLKTALQVNENIKTPKDYQAQIAQYQRNEPSHRPGIHLLEDSSGFLVTNLSGDSIHLSMLEFGNLVKFGEKLDIRNEVENYLSDIDLIGSIPTHLITNSEEALDMLTENIRSHRIDAEKTNQIYWAANEIKDELAKLLYDDILGEIDQFLDPDEDYYGMKGSDLSESGALKILADYILIHESDTFEAFSDMVYHAVFECEDTLKTYLENQNTLSLDKKVSAIEQSKEQKEPKLKTSMEFER